MSLFKEGYTLPKVESNWLTFEEGVTARFRVLSEIKTGYLFWTDDKGTPLERPVKGCVPVYLPDEARDQLPPVRYKYVWLAVCWEYASNRLKIARLTQRKIQNTLFGYYQDSEWGDFRQYDISVTRQGNGINSSYEVKVYAPKPVEEAILEAYKAANIQLEALYKGQNPWGEEPAEADQARQQANGQARPLAQA